MKLNQGLKIMVKISLDELRANKAMNA